MDGTQILTDFRSKFQVDELLVAKTPAWSWSVRPAQATLACGVLSLNRPVTAFSQLSPASFAELHEVTRDIETALSKAFHFDKINYLMLMMVDPDVHFHVLPRYAQPKIFAGLEFTDYGWPAVPNLGHINATGSAVNQQIIEHLQSFWS